MAQDKLTFWDHLDVLRGVLIRVICVTLILSVVAFIFKDQMFEIVLAPKSPHFITYRCLDVLCRKCGVAVPETFEVSLINTGLARQFMIHMKTAFCLGVMGASPYILYEIFSFVSPALYKNERRLAVKIVINGYLMFAVGLLVSYFIVFPMTFRFLGTYEVADDVKNLISLDSYMSTLLTMSLCMGLIFEMPVLAWLFGKAGILTSAFMRRYRRHAIVIILTLAAIITPTSDVFTLLLVSVPMYLLFEISIILVRQSERTKHKNASVMCPDASTFPEV